MVVGFNQSGAKRIVDAVKKVERLPQDRSGGSTPLQHQFEESFWAKITGRSLDGAAMSWMRVQPAPQGDGSIVYLPMQPAITGEENAYEVNENPDVPGGAIVRLALAAITPEGLPLYSFQYGQRQGGRMVPIHDHRDNFNGGFAFAVFSPGTALPTRSWGI